MTGPANRAPSVEHDARSVVGNRRSPALVADRHGHPRVAAVAVRAPDCLLRPRLVLDRRSRLGRLGAAGVAGPHWCPAERRTVRVRVTGNDGSAPPWSEPLTGGRPVSSARDWSAGSWGRRDDDPGSRNRAPTSGEVRVRCPCHQRASTRRRSACTSSSSTVPVSATTCSPRVGAATSTGSATRPSTYRPAARGDERRWSHVGDGWFRGRARRCLRSGTATATARPALPARAHLRRRHDHEVVADDEWRARRARSSPPGSTKARPTTRAREFDGWSQPGFDDTDWSAVTTVEHDLGTPSHADGPAGRGSRTHRARRDHHVTVRSHDRRLRPEPRRPGRARA